MKITKNYLKQIIKEELEKLIESQEVSQDFVESNWDYLSGPSGSTALKAVKDMKSLVSKPGSIFRDCDYYFEKSNRANDKQKLAHAANLAKQNMKLFAACIMGLARNDDPLSKSPAQSQENLYKTLFGQSPVDHQFLVGILGVFRDIYGYNPDD